MNKDTGIKFDGQVIYVGLDVHKKSWKVSLQMEGITLKTYSQDPKVELLIRHLKKFYPGAEYKAAYEAGFSGYWIAEQLAKNGIDCLVVHAIR